jgi:hypothetical protein
MKYVVEMDSDAMILSRDCDMDEFWIGNWMYSTFTDRNYK